MVAALMIEEPETVSVSRISEQYSLDYRTALRLRLRLRQALIDPQSRELLEAAIRDLLPNSRPKGVRSSLWEEETTSPDPRNNILATAVELFVQRGFAAVLVADVARAAGVSSAIVRGYFPSKRDMLLAALVWVYRRNALALETQLAEAGDEVARLVTLLELSMPAKGGHGDDYVLWCEAVVLARDDMRQLVSHEDFLRWTKALRQIVRSGHEAGVFSPVAPVRVVTDRIMLLLEGLSLWTLYGLPPDYRSQWAFVTTYVAQQLGIPRAVLDSVTRGTGADQLIRTGELGTG